jgi:hypothetical protein
MLPNGLSAEQFANYQPQAKQLAIANINLLRQLPLLLAALLLKEVKAYDWKFPAEREEVDAQFVYLRSLTRNQLQQAMEAFARIELPGAMADLDWVNFPEVFSQYLSSTLWATNQIESFRAASVQYVGQYRAAIPVEPLAVRRLTIVVVGQGVTATSIPLFRKLRPYGAYYAEVAPKGGMKSLLEAVSARVQATPLPYAHWYLDGGKAAPADAALTCVSYDSLSALRLAVLKKMRALGQVSKGPEGLQHLMLALQPEQLGLHGASGDAVLDRFRMSIFTEGSGTQFYSTTFVQWSAHELLRRAQPLTTLVRFAPRQIQRSLDEMLVDGGETLPKDPEGSLVDANMGAYYIWLNQRRLVDSDKASFLVWFEDHNEALIVSPKISAGTVSREPVTLDRMLDSIA